MRPRFQMRMIDFPPLKKGRQTHLESILIRFSSFKILRQKMPFRNSVVLVASDGSLALTLLFSSVVRPFPVESKGLYIIA